MSRDLESCNGSIEETSAFATSRQSLDTISNLSRMARDVSRRAFLKTVESILRAMSRICENAVARRKAQIFLHDQLKSLRLLQHTQSRVRSCIALRELTDSKIRMANLRRAASVAASVGMMKITRSEMRNIILISRFCQKCKSSDVSSKVSSRILASALLIQKHTRGLMKRLRYRRRLRSVHAFQMAYRLKRILENQLLKT